eukprot:snap_masked-scaffold_15-processed-gene-8.34-mRNA-1 protein AED:1.00 eAED:1.00 QI:0/0/0/0/1/1/2/0/75
MVDILHTRANTAQNNSKLYIALEIELMISAWSDKNFVEHDTTDIHRTDSFKFMCLNYLKLREMLNLVLDIEVKSF